MYKGEKEKLIEALGKAKGKYETASKILEKFPRKGSKHRAYILADKMLDEALEEITNIRNSLK